MIPAYPPEVLMPFSAIHPHVGGLSRPGRSTWSDQATRASLLLLAEALRETTGFGVVTIGVVDDQGTCETVAVASDEPAAVELLGSRVPVRTLEELMADGTRVGEVSFVRDLVLGEGLHHVSWRRADDSEGDDAWHPHDWLVAVARDGDGQVVGIVQLDVPADGRRPDTVRLGEVDRRCATAARSVVAARDRERLSARARMAVTARDVVRTSSGRQSVSSILARSHDAVLEGFRARGLFIQVLDEHGAAQISTVYRADGRETAVPRAVTDVAERDARSCWAAQQVVVVDRHHPGEGWLSREERRRLLAYLESSGAGSLLFVPTGVGGTCLGSLTLTRGPGDPTWSDEERATALDIGHDLGHAILDARAHRREQELLHELRQLDAYKSDLIATVSHELRNPLSAVTGHLEILRSMPETADSTERSLLAMERGTRRLERIVEDLLTFSEVGDPARGFAPAVVDLGEVVRGVRELHDLPARRRQQRVEVDLPEEPVLVRGLPDDLDTVASNLVANALKYSAEGTVVRLTLEQDAREVVLRCTDQGLGISEEDQHAVFGEFFRSADPAVRRQGGSGLGLAIVGRIVKRHRGRVSVDSTIGRGSTFRVLLPSVGEFERAAGETEPASRLGRPSLDQARQPLTRNGT